MLIHQKQHLSVAGQHVRAIQLRQNAQTPRRNVFRVAFEAVEKGLFALHARIVRARTERNRRESAGAETLGEAFRGVRAQGSRYGALRSVEDGRAESQAHVALGRVHVRVHVIRRQLEKEHAVRMPPDHREGRIAGRPRTREQRAAQQPAVHEQQLQAPVRAIAPGLADEPRQRAVQRRGSGRRERKQRLCGVAAEHHGEALVRFGRRGHYPHVLSIVAQGERHGGIGERKRGEPSGDAIELRARRTQILAAHRNVFEQPANAHSGSRRSRGGLGFADRIAGGGDARAQLLAGAPRDDLDA